VWSGRREKGWWGCGWGTDRWEVLFLSGELKGGGFVARVD